MICSPWIFRPRPASPSQAPPELLKGLGMQPQEVFRSRDYLVVFDNEAIVRDLIPDMRLLEQVDCTGVIVTAPGDTTDFVSRFFAPKVGIPEDPVTGSYPLYADSLLGRKAWKIQTHGSTAIATWR